MTFVPIEDYKCPFGARDLTRGKDECYSGSGENRCPHFVRYVWGGEHDGCIACAKERDLFGGDYD